MKPFRILIVEDEPIIAEDLALCLEDLGYEICGKATSAAEALPLIRSEAPDLLFLDIFIEGDEDGIQLAERVREEFKIPFIFLSSYSDPLTLKRARQTRPSGYLVKPFDEKDLPPAIEIALYNFTHPEAEPVEKPEEEAALFSDEAFFVKRKDLFVKVQANEIRWVEAWDNYSHLHTDSEKYLLSSSLKSVSEKLEGLGFLRVHRSYLINPGAVTAIGETHILIGEEKIPVGKTYRAELLRRLPTL